MKVIDLLNKIANGEPLPKKIMHNNIIYDWDIDGYLHYEDEHYSERAFLEGYRTDMCLNDEVKIVEDTPKEDKKIEKLDVVLIGQCDNWLQPTIETSEKIRAELNPYIIDVIRENTLNIQGKLNEIIDKINGGE